MIRCAVRCQRHRRPACSYYFDYDLALALRWTTNCVSKGKRISAKARDAADAPLRQLSGIDGAGGTRTVSIAPNASWDKVRDRFGRRGFDLPDHFYYNDGLFPILQAAYSAKEGRPVACRQTHLIQLANTLFNSHKRVAAGLPP